MPSSTHDNYKLSYLHVPSILIALGFPFRPSAMADFDITAAMDSIPSKLDNLRKAFEALDSSPSFVSSALKWLDIEHHFAGLQDHVHLRLQDLHQLESPSAAAFVRAKAKAQTMLRSFCSKSDGSALWFYFLRGRKNWRRNRREIRSLVYLCPDAAKLALDFVDEYRRWVVEGKLFRLPVMSSVALDLLDHVRRLGPGIGAGVRERARGVGREWKGNFAGGGGTDVEAMVFCRFLVAYQVVSEFERVEVLDLFVRCSEGKESDDDGVGRNVYGRNIDLLKGLGLDQNVSGNICFAYEVIKC